MLSVQFHWTFFLIACVIFMVYYNVSTFPMAVENVEKLRSSVSVKKIVSYSLRKKIELEGEEYFCQNLMNVSGRPVVLSSFWYKVPNTELYITSVTLDQRLKPFNYVRIVGAVKGNWTETVYCQILSNDGHVRIIKSTVDNIWYDKWDTNDNHTYFNPVLLSCRLPESQKDPVAVSISVQPCRLNALCQLPALMEKSQTNFTLCVKPLNFKKDISQHLVQWIELCKLVGAQYFHIFVEKVSINTRQMLKWYKKEFPDMFHIEDFETLKNPQSLNRTLFQTVWQKRRFEIVTYNKCLYQNLNSRFVVPLDIDEVIVPKTVNHWNDIVRSLDDSYTSLITRNVYFFKRNSNRNNRPFFLNELRRTKIPSGKGENGKSFVSTKSALTVFNHYALHLLRPGASNEYFIPFAEAQLNHYKESCDHVIFPDCVRYLSSPIVYDYVVSRYKDDFYREYNNVMEMLWRNKTFNL